MENPAKLFTHLSVETRATIAVLHGQGKGVRAIARAVQRSPSTISRELKRNWHEPSKTYICDVACAKVRVRRWDAKPKRKLHRNGRLWLHVASMLSWHWSPSRSEWNCNEGIRTNAR